MSSGGSAVSGAPAKGVTGKGQWSSVCACVCVCVFTLQLSFPACNFDRSDRSDRSKSAADPVSAVPVVSQSLSLKLRLSFFLFLSFSFSLSPQSAGVPF